MQFVANAASAEGSGMESTDTGGGGDNYDSHSSTSTRMCWYLARLQLVFEMPSLHVNQL